MNPETSSGKTIIFSFFVLIQRRTQDVVYTKKGEYFLLFLDEKKQKSSDSTELC
jgi:hypothetical protein